MQVRPYQEILKAEIRAQWAAGKQNVLAVASTGSGKTKIFSDVIRENDGESCTIAHRQEIVGQISLALARNGVRHNVIASAAVVRMIHKLHIRELGKTWVDAHSRDVVAGVQTLLGQPNAPWMKRINLFVCDECFPAGTLVDGVPIENVRVGDYVTAFNEATGRLEKREVLRLFKNPMPKYMVRATMGHHVIESTGRHPYYTKRGWVEAKDLTNKDEVLHVSGWTRLDNVEIYKSGGARDSQRSDGGRFVYNIEVSGVHTYLANGVVVHNCHHLLKTNQWGRAAAMFPNARGLLVTATPIRADGAGLSREYDGIADVMLQAPPMRDLITAGYLSDYKIYAPPSDVDYSNVPLAASGDLSLPALRAAVHKSGTIVGDVVSHYVKLAGGKSGVTFAVDIEAAKELALAYRQAGIPAEIVTGKTDDLTRSAIMRRFAGRDFLQLVSVDILGEGVDVPGIEVASFVRKTESLSLYLQQSGRTLRTAPGKQHAIIIDHVGNVIRHNLPDVPRDWTIGMKRRERKSKPKVGEIPLRQCLNSTCMAVYERVHKVCPFCNHAPVVTSRSAPEHVDGDLAELSPEACAALRGEIAANAVCATHPNHIINASLHKKFREKSEEQDRLKGAISLYGGWRESQGHSISESQRFFFFEFGIDVGTAQTLNRAESESLRVRVVERLTLDNVVEAPDNDDLINDTE